MSSPGGLLDAWFYFALVPLVVFVPIIVASISVLHTMRDTHVVTQRSYFFVLLQNIGCLVFIVLLSADMMTTSRQYCDVQIWKSTVPFSFLVLPLFMRVWIYCFRYYLTRERKKHEGRGGRWRSVPKAFMRRLRMIKSSFLLRLWVCAFSVLILLPVLSTVVRVATNSPAWVPRHNDSAQICLWQDNNVGSGVTYGLAALSAIIIIFSMKYLWKSEDVYHIKGELKALLAIWVVDFVVLEVLSGLHLGTHVPLNMVVALGVMATAFLTGPWLVFLAYKERRLRKTSSDLAKILPNTDFRAEFSDFLSIQLSVENLLFYEEVQVYKILPAGPEQIGLAVHIFSKYIAKEAPCEINISDQTKQMCSMRMAVATSITRDVFANAEREVFHNLQFHSFPLFLSLQAMSPGQRWSITARLPDTVDIVVGMSEERPQQHVKMYNIPRSMHAAA
eukprot:TRINITY_DN8219_c0_g1_i1.p1 TRINITY_DN8219_c0_g1~~TRINITY_DN8219_c0_g1_i1.p1  ORF type:complete len:462 (+),score=29.01 TRINITY_DN8219_c0_g1_i1:47-1387(+)